MYILDAIIALPLLYFAYRGFTNGLLKEVLNIVGVILAVFITFRYIDAFGSILVPLFSDNSQYIPFLSGALLFIGTLAVVAIAGYLTKELLDAVNLGLINRLLGAFFGMIKCGIVVSTILLILAGFNFPGQQTRDESYLYAPILYLGPWTYDFVALLYPNAEGYTETLKENLSKYNPIDNLPFLNEK